MLQPKQGENSQPRGCHYPWTVFALPSIKDTLSTQKILVSPLDADRIGTNDTLDWANATWNGGSQRKYWYILDGMSYGLNTGYWNQTLAADQARPTTIVTVTRNMGPGEGMTWRNSLSTGYCRNREGQKKHGYKNSAEVDANIKYSVWYGADKHALDPNSMASLNANAGQLGLADGSASQENDASLANKIQSHKKALGGTYKGVPCSRTMLPYRW